MDTQRSLDIPRMASADRDTLTPGMGVESLSARTAPTDRDTLTRGMGVKSLSARTAPTDRDTLTRGSQSNSLFLNMCCAPPESTEVNIPLPGTTPETTTTVTQPALSFSKLQQGFTCLALAVYQIVSGAYHIESGALNLIRVLSPHFSWLLLISPVCRIGSGLRSLGQGFRRIQHWNEAEDQQLDDDTTTINLTALSSKLWQCAQLLLTASMIGSIIFDLFDLFSIGFSWKLLIAAVSQIGSGVFDLVPESRRLLYLILREAKKILSSKAQMCRDSLIIRRLLHLLTQNYSPPRPGYAEIV